MIIPASQSVPGIHSKYLRVAGENLIREFVGRWVNACDTHSWQRAEASCVICHMLHMTDDEKLLESLMHISYQATQFARGAHGKWSDRNPLFV